LYGCNVKVMFKEWNGQAVVSDVQKLYLIDSTELCYQWGVPILNGIESYIDTKVNPGDVKMTLGVGLPVHGVCYNYSVSANLRGLEPRLFKDLPKLLQKKWTLLLTDMSGTSYVLGPSARMTFDGQLDSESKGGQITWTGVAKKIFSTEYDVRMYKGVIDLRKYETRNILVYKGDTLRLELEWPDENDGLEVLTGMMFKCLVKNASGEVILSFDMDDGFHLEDDDKKLIMSKSPEETDIIIPGDYKYVLQRTDADGVVETKLRGLFVIEGDV
jgi:hypothetical protein